MPDRLQTVRAFIAVHLDPAVLGAVIRAQERLERKLGLNSVRFTPRSQLHLTLRFLGNIAATQIQPLSAAIMAACAGQGPFQLSIEGFGGFPSLRHPNVLWFGVGGETTRLAQLQAGIEEPTGPFGEHTEKREFAPHLTIARVKNARPADYQRLAELPPTEVGVLGNWTVSSVELMQSELSPKGARYTQLCSAKLS